ncbi:MAG: hydroxymethylglutaryl-CoA lyase [Acidobacteriota bacterium]
MSRWPERVTVYEVGPRDGLQNVPDTISTETKVRFVEALRGAGLPAVEVTSFVSPKWVPQLADGAEVFSSLKDTEGARLPVLVPNLKGLEAALTVGAREVAVFTAASEAFNQKNINASIAESIARFEPVAKKAQDEGLTLRGYVSTAFGCPYQGDVPEDDVVDTCDRLFQLGCAEVSVGDTIGVGDPGQVQSLCLALGVRFELERIALHLHDTPGRALANVVTALRCGVTTFDSSAGGLGGCPYAPGAAGNLATEDLVEMLHRLGVGTGVDLEALADASVALAEETGLPQPSRVLQAIRARRARES